MTDRHMIVLTLLIALVCSLIAGCTSFPGNAGSGAMGNPVTTPSPVLTGTGTTDMPLSGVTSSAGQVTTPLKTGPNVSIDLIAKKMAFNTSAITVPAGANVVIRFSNQEAAGSSQVTGIPHNFAVYTSSNATTKIFTGDIITGGENITYTFVAPETPGTYYFRCDVHPAVMHGTFIVT
jgi:plastocyanin